MISYRGLTSELVDEVRFFFTSMVTRLGIGMSRMRMEESEREVVVKYKDKNNKILN